MDGYENSYVDDGELIQSFETWLETNCLEIVTTSQVSDTTELFPVSFVIDTFLESKFCEHGLKTRQDELMNHYHHRHYFQRTVHRLNESPNSLCG